MARMVQQPDLFAAGARMVAAEAVDLTVASLKRCARCFERKERSAFAKASKERDGLTSRCKACRKAAYKEDAPAHRTKQTAYYRANIDARRAAQRAYNSRTAAQRSQRDKAARAAEPPERREKRRAAGRAWTLANRDKVKADLRAWRERNQEKIRAKGRERTIVKADDRRRYERDRRRMKPGWDKAKKNTRRARVRAAAGSFSPAEWAVLCALFGRRCVACTRELKLTADHVVPLAASGSNDISNIQPLCQPCNSSKGTRTIDYRPARIEALIAAGTWPDGWVGDEPTADAWLDAVFPDGAVQPLLRGVSPAPADPFPLSGTPS